MYWQQTAASAGLHPTAVAAADTWPSAAGTAATAVVAAAAPATAVPAAVEPSTFLALFHSLAASVAHKTIMKGICVNHCSHGDSDFLFSSN